METQDWPENLLPKQQNFYLRTTTIQFQNPSHIADVSARPWQRWVAELSFHLSADKAAQLDALLARLRGRAGAVLVPNALRLETRMVPESMDAYAAKIGTTFFDDHYDFDDQVLEDGFLTWEEPAALGLEEDISLGEFFDLILVFPRGTALLTEADDILMAENVLVPFILENGKFLTLEDSPELEIGAEDGLAFETEDGADITVQRGGGFFEGVGQASLAGGADTALTITGCAPFTDAIVRLGETISPSPGRLHIIIADTATDIDGRGMISIMPPLRDAVVQSALIMGGGTVKMRLVSDDAGKNETVPPIQVAYQLSFEEILPL